jgi:transcriptional regulator with XRE-family HTH domain
MSQGLTQMSLALEAGLSRNMVIGIEWGEKSVAYERLWDIADVLGVNVHDLFSDASTREPSSDSHRRGSAKGSTRSRLSVDPEAK